MIYLLILACYWVGITLTSIPMTGDQKTYISIAIEMLERQEWIVPTLFGAPNFLKPPFQYWMSILGFKIFGLSTLGCVLPSVLALIGVAHYTQKLAPNQNRWAPLFVCGTIASMTYGSTTQMEIWILLFFLAAWSLFLANKWLQAFVVVGAMALVKGPLYPALWVMGSLMYLGLEGRLKECLSRRYVFSLGVGVLVGISWYLLVSRTHLESMLNEFFYKENLGKIQTGQGSAFGLWTQFFLTLGPILPWFIFSLRKTSDLRKNWMTHKNLWRSYALIPALFFTFFPYRVSTYLYLLTPVVIWLLCSNSDLEVETHKKKSRALGWITLAVSLIIGFLGYRLYCGDWLSLWVYAGLLLSLFIWSLGHWRLKAQFVAIGCLFLVNTIRVAGIGLGEHDLRDLRAISSDQPLAYYMERYDIWHEYGLVSTALGKRIQVYQSEGDIQNHLNKGGAVIFTDEQASLTQSLECASWHRLKRRVKFPIKELLVHGLSINDPALTREYKICTRRPT